MQKTARIEPEDIRVLMGEDPEAYEERMERFFPFPKVINIELTNKCNLKCIMCIRDLERPAGFMAESLFRKIIDEASQYDPKLWLNFAGEPLLHERFLEFVSYCRKKRISSININTNAVLIDEEMATKLAVSGLDTIALSFDSIEKDVYESIRVNASFEEVKANVENFIRIRNKLAPAMKINIFAVKQESNIQRLEAFKDYWAEYLSDDDKIVGIEYNTLGGQLERPAVIRLPHHPQDRLPCLQLWRNSVILWNGDMVICCGDFRGRNVMGNVARDSMKDVWFNKRYKKLRLAHLKGDYTEFDFCGHCDEWAFEGGKGRYNDL